LFLSSFSAKIGYMKNWSTDLNELKRDKKQYTIWRLEQLINFGLGKTKISTKELKKYWSHLYIDPSKKKYLSFLLWPNKQS